MPKHARPIVVDLFSGCGGFALGAELAGFHVAMSIDKDSTLHSSFSTNFPKTKALTADVSKLGQAFWRKHLEVERVDGVIGGPPCQGFSRIGRRSADDARNSLVASYFDQVLLLRPKFFVMENVDGILDQGNADLLFTELQRISRHYRILDPLRLNASDYGAATSRTRIIVVGYDPDACDLAELPGKLRAKALSKKRTVRDAIDDLPGPSPLDEWARYRRAAGEVASDYARALRKLPPVRLSTEAVRSKLALGLVSGNQPTRHTPEVTLRFKTIEAGKSDPIGRLPRLDWNGLCPTLRAGTGADKGSYQSVRPIHPSQPRVITVREAARLQGFPDWFTFHATKWHSFRMIGNSVSPALASSVLLLIYGSLQLV